MSPLRRAFYFSGALLEGKRNFSITDFYLLLAMIIWGSDYPFAKYALREVSPMSFSAMRTIVGGLILLPFFLKQEKNWGVSWRHLLYFTGVAFLGTFLNRICWSIGLDLTTASNSALLMATAPIFVLVASSFVARTEVHGRAALGVIISFLGVFLVVQGDWKGWTATSRGVWGDLIILAAAFFWAMFTVLAKPLLKDHSSIKVTAYMVILGSAFLAPFLPNDKAGGWGEVSWFGWVSVLYVGLMGNGVAYFLWIKGIKNIGPLRTMLYSYLTPITAILFAVPLLHESITSIQAWGTAVVFGGIFLARSK